MGLHSNWLLNEFQLFFNELAFHWRYFGTRHCCQGAIPLLSFLLLAQKLANSMMMFRLAKCTMDGIRKPSWNKPLIFPDVDMRTYAYDSYEL
jgi:hypothetical protein